MNRNDEVYVKRLHTLHAESAFDEFLPTENAFADVYFSKKKVARYSLTAKKVISEVFVCWKSYCINKQKFV